MSRSNSANVYDFDHTIYRGDASFDFIKYCLLRDPKLWKCLPVDALAVLRYAFGLSDRKQLKQTAFAFLDDSINIDATLTGFWAKHEHKIKEWYLNGHKDTDVIISASPDFLLEPIAKQLKVYVLLATRMDKHTGEIKGENCRGKEKLRRLRDYDASLKVNKFYGDSLSDMPLFKLAAEPYVVKNDKIIPLSNYKLSRLRHFRSPVFLRFLLVGSVNAFLGVCFAYIASFFITNTLLAWVVGYLASLAPSYLLNAIITFRRFKFSLVQFGSFCVSYIPNFIVQFICVHILTNYLGLYRLAAYILAVIIGIPITFLLLATFTFKH